MKKSNHIFIFSIVLSLLFGFAFPLFAQEGTGKPSNKTVNQKIGKLQIPFIANEGQMDEKVKFYAYTFGNIGTLPLFFQQDQASDMGSVP